MAIVPLPAGGVRPRARELASALEVAVDEYRRGHPEVTDLEIRQAFEVVGLRSVPRIRRVRMLAFGGAALALVAVALVASGASGRIAMPVLLGVLVVAVLLGRMGMGRGP